MQGDDGGSPVYSSSLTATTNHSVLQVTQISDHESIQEEKKIEMLSHNQKKTITAHLESCKAYRKADAGELLSNRADPKELSTSELAKLLWSCPDVI